MAGMSQVTFSSSDTVLNPRDLVFSTAQGGVPGVPVDPNCWPVILGRLKPRAGRLMQTARNPILPFDKIMEHWQWARGEDQPMYQMVLEMLLGGC